MGAARRALWVALMRDVRVLPLRSATPAHPPVFLSRRRRVGPPPYYWKKYPPRFCRPARTHGKITPKRQKLRP